MMLPTARAAPGRPASAATSPYVATRPYGMRRTTVRTREVKSGRGREGGIEKSAVDAREGDPDERCERGSDVRRCHGVAILAGADAWSHQDQRDALIVDVRCAVRRAGGDRNPARLQGEHEIPAH